MWTRKEIKKTGKARFLMNYWKGVLVALILTLVLGGFSNSGFRNDIRIDGNNISQTSSVGIVADYKEARDIINGISENGLGETMKELNDDITDEDVENIEHAKDVMIENANVILPMIAVTSVAFFLVVFALGVGVNVFLLNPVEVGTRRYFVKNETENASLKEMGVSFSNSYLNVVKTMFLRDLFTILWTLLFVIPGIIKTYEYRMIPYIVAENPDITSSEAFELSKKMMKGNKWKTFVLDLSFIGWHILSGLTLGLLGIFYVNPYLYQTNAALYNTLKDKNVVETTPESYESYIEVK